ncbi:MAG: sugar transferase [Hyphomicrobium sp.]|nr:sugar transferase [Hyphomicrobium sp.]
MGSWKTFGFDLVLVLVAAVAAIFLRDNFETSLQKLAMFWPYFSATLVVAVFVLPLTQTHRVIWRLSTRRDYARVVLATALITFGTLLALFAYNRLEGVARSLPFLHWMLMSAALVGARVLFRAHHDGRSARRLARRGYQTAKADPAKEHVLVVGLSQMTEAYLASISELASDRLKVAGVLSARARHVGQLVAETPVLGIPDDVERVLKDLDVHGVTIQRVVVTVPFHSLSDTAKEALLRVDAGGSTQLMLLVDDIVTPMLGVSKDSEMRDDLPTDPEAAELYVQMDEAEIQRVLARPYWKFKRVTDFAFALAILVLILPVMLIVGLMVAIRFGFPITFWQQRPGRFGMPFRVYKFRTMGPAYDVAGHRISDEFRSGLVGMFLRRTRLDELPQLWNILRGEMSFVGPRPLLPRDQAPEFNSRLLVRPGLTGWAQIAGGRDINAEDKAVLDVWYVRNASLGLDLEIALRTVPMVIRGERVLGDMIERAWVDLLSDGILKGERALPRRRSSDVVTAAE